MSTDINILSHMKKPRRNSCPYIKPLLQLDKNGDNLPSQK
jgi:hypothetical protein